MTDEVHVAFSVCDNTGEYGKYAATAIASLLINTKSHVVIHILHDEETSSRTLSMLSKTARMYNADIFFYKVSIPEDLHMLDSLNNITIGTLFRLYLPNVCQVNKIIYLDVDILLNIDIVELWHINIEAVYAAVVIDVENTRNRYIDTLYYKKIGIDKDKYFNAGVMYMNLDYIRNNLSLLDDGLKILTKYNHLAFADQDVLNSLFADQVKYVSNIFNYQIDLKSEDCRIPECSCIMHFSGAVKPWNCIIGDAMNKHFMAFLCTAYKKSKYDIASYVNSAVQGYARRMDLKHCILEKKKGKPFFINILLTLRLFIGNDVVYRKVCSKIWDIRHRLRYNFLYVVGK